MIMKAKGKGVLVTYIAKKSQMRNRKRSNSILLS